MLDLLVSLIVGFCLNLIVLKTVHPRTVGQLGYLLLGTKIIFFFVGMAIGWQISVVLPSTMVSVNWFGLNNNNTMAILILLNGIACFVGASLLIWITGHPRY